MAGSKDSKKYPKKTSTSVNSTSISEDLEKTTLDIDIRNLDQDMEKTAIVDVSRGTLEDSDLHTVGDPQDEKTRFFEMPPSDETPPSDDNENEEEREEEEKEEETFPKVQDLPKPIFNFKRDLPYLIGAVVFLILLSESLLESLQTGPSLRLPSILTVVFVALVILMIFLNRLQAKRAFLATAVATAALVTYAGVNYSTLDERTLHLFRYPLSDFLGVALLIFGLVIAITMFLEKALPIWLRLIPVLSCLLLAVAVTFCLPASVPLQDGIWGPEFLSVLPLFAKPGVLALGVAFPLDLIVLILAVFLLRSSGVSFLKSVGVLLILTSLLGSFLGLKLLSRQGIDVPFLGSLLATDFYGETLIDPNGTSTRLKVLKGKRAANKTYAKRFMMGVTRPVTKGSKRQSVLLLRNLEGRPFVSDINPYLFLSRGGQKIKGTIADLREDRLGQPRNLALVIDMTSLSEDQTRAAVAGAIYRLANVLNAGEHLYLVHAEGLLELDARTRPTWKSKIQQVLGIKAGHFNQLLSLAFAKLEKVGGIKQIIYLCEKDGFPQLDLRQNWENKIEKNKIQIHYVVLGQEHTAEPRVYSALDPSAVGFELLASASYALGQYFLDLPKLPEGPQLKFVRDASDKVVIQDGRINFEVLASVANSVQGIRWSVDGQQSVALDPRSSQQVIDLNRLKLTPGEHTFEVTLTTSSGEDITEVLHGDYVLRSKLEFIKPLDQDTVASTFNVFLSPGYRPSLFLQGIELFVDGRPIGTATTEPFLIELDTTLLSEGPHNLQAVQTYAGGETESADIQIHVKQQTPQIAIVRPSVGEYLSNVAEIEARIGGELFEQIDRVEFFVDGQWIGESVQAPFRLLWTNHVFSAGEYFIQARGHLRSQVTTTDTVQVHLGQGSIVVKADPSLSPSGTLIPNYVEVLLDISSNMNEPIGSSIKLDIAKVGLNQLIQSLSSETKYKVRVYGGEGDSSYRGCRSSALLQKLPKDFDFLEAQGLAPLGYALEHWGEDIKKISGSRVGLLITSSWDECGQDPLDFAQALLKSVGKMRLHIIYFADISPSAESLLKRLAEILGGRTYKVASSEELKQAIQEAVQVSFTVYDYKNTVVLSQALSPTPFKLRSGQYRLEIDTIPPVIQENVVVPTEGLKSFTLLHNDEKYELLAE